MKNEKGKIKNKIREEIQKIVKGEIKFDEPLARHTSFGIGGPADCFVTPQDIEDLRKIILFSRKRKLPLRVMGQGTNLLVRDKGVRGIVIKLGKGFEGIKFSGDHLLAGAAVRLSTLIKLVASKGLGSLEFAVGIPGSLGGAVATNAGTGGLSISQRLRSIRVMSGEGRVKDLGAKDLNFGYRRCPLGKDSIILDARLRLERAKEEEILRRMNTFLEKREKTQPLGAANAGCIFKNPDPKTPAARLIEEAGLKGKRIGRAAVSKVHANFILNLGRARAEDVLTLMEAIKEEVKGKTAIDLEPEIEIWGED